ncbi:MAG TPA: aldehyde dehydrogenase family protein [Ilumatobacteraceae bacterium]|nr:aldehyde dehydrogenase family protein [Ilumatobacteraceae bacterium]
MSQQLTQPLANLAEGQVLVYGGDRASVVSAELAAAFTAGDRLVIVQDSGDLLHIPATEHQLAEAAVARAADAFAALASCTDQQISDFFERFAAAVDDDDVFAPVLAANAADVAAATAKGRSTTRLVLSPPMRADMSAGLRSWAASPIRREQLLSTIDHAKWSVSSWRAPLGVVGFVFEGRPNVFADATGVLRTGNTAVFRIGSDALRTAQAIMQHCLAPALAAAGLPVGAVQLIESAAHAAGWALFTDARLGLAVARGSGAAVAQLGTVARQHGVPVSLHGTGGAWIVASEHADAAVLAETVEHSLDRKVCNTMNVCCIPRSRSAELTSVVVDAAQRAAARRGTDAVMHRVEAHETANLGQEWEWDDAPEYWLVEVDSVAEAVELFNRYSPRFSASLISDELDEQERFYASIDAPFVGNGFTRWVDGQFALDQPELGLSNWQAGRLFARGGVLSGDSVYTVRLRAEVRDHSVHR